ncbi:DNA-3-methyladenine glycosylase I [Christensenellaceae bacterium]|nr:DNA-3-methyladenine glycosylase I [Christensenellaceae bacterium]BDF62413.1 DNA-3-methyladenine glycosylase I [Christensenellaceae bacterium]
MNMKTDKKRCSWATDDILIDYHDNEYGKIKSDSNALFEKLCLESFQAGLSWRTVLVKRDAFRRAFLGFDIGKCANLTDEYLESLMQDETIIRNRRKIFAVRENARAVERLNKEYGNFFRFVYSLKKPEQLLKALKQHGFVFVGYTICESFMQSIGIIEAHEPDCYLYTPSGQVI